MYWKSPFFPPQKCLLLSLPPPLLTSARSCCDKPETNSTGNTNCWNYWSRTIKACISVDEKSPSRRKFRKMESLGKKMAKRKSKNRLGCDSFLGKKAAFASGWMYKERCKHTEGEAAVMDSNQDRISAGKQRWRSVCLAWRKHRTGNSSGETVKKKNNIYIFIFSLFEYLCLLCLIMLLHLFKGQKCNY